MNKIEIFSFDANYIKNEIEKEILKNKKVKEMEIFKNIILSLNNEELIIYKSSNIIIKALADFEDGIVKHNIDSILLTSSFLLTYKDIFNNNKPMYEFSFEIEGNKLFLKYKNQYVDNDIYDYKIKNAIELFKNTMMNEDNYQIIIKEIILSFIEKIEKTYLYISNLIEVKENITEEEVIKEIFFNIAEHKAYEEYNKWIVSLNDNRKE